MGSVLVGVVGTLLGVVLGGALQQVQASRARRWQRDDALRNTKRAVYAEYLRSISTSYVQAMSGLRTRSEDANLYAATAQIDVLCSPAISEPARELTETVISVHSRIATGGGVAQGEIDDVDSRRRQLIGLFKTDIGLSPAPIVSR